MFYLFFTVTFTAPAGRNPSREAPSEEVRRMSAVMALDTKEYPNCSYLVRLAGASGAVPTHGHAH